MLNIESELHELAITTWLESSSEGFCGMLAVAHVILNRVEDKRWPGTIRSVVHQPWQFSCWNSDQGMDNWRAYRLEGIHESPAWKECLKVCCGAYFGFLPDPTDGSCHYLVSEIADRTHWAEGVEPTVVIGAHSFFNNVD